MHLRSLPPHLKICAQKLGLLAALAVAAAAVTAPSHAQEDAGKTKAALATPMPPVRPKLPTAAVSPSAPKSAATGQSQQPAINDPVATIAYPDHGPSLPAASRNRMHECGEKWQEMKASGAAAELTWRAFAQFCLAH